MSHYIHRKHIFQLKLPITGNRCGHSSIPYVGYYVEILDVANNPCRNQTLKIVSKKIIHLKSGVIVTCTRIVLRIPLII